MVFSLLFQDTLLRVVVFTVSGIRALEKPRSSPFRMSFLFVFLFVCLYLTCSTADGSQHARLPIPPTATLPSCLESQRIIPSLPGSCLMILYRDASSELLQFGNWWLDFNHSRSHAFRYERKNVSSVFLKNRTHHFRTTSDVRGYLLNHSSDDGLSVRWKILVLVPEEGVGFIFFLTCIRTTAPGTYWFCIRSPSRNTLINTITQSTEKSIIYRSLEKCASHLPTSLRACCIFYFVGVSS